MLKRIAAEKTTPIPEVQLDESEEMLFCGVTPKHILYSLDPRKKLPETAMLTNRRLVVCSLVADNPAHIGGRTPSVTSLPLSKVDAIQVTHVSWTAIRALVCVLLFCLYIIPGLCFLVWMSRNTGPRVNVVSGLLRVEVRFADANCDLLRKFVNLLSLHASHSWG